MSNLDKQLLIFGCGYVGKQLAQQAKTSYKKIIGIVSKPESLNGLDTLNISGHAINLDVDTIDLPEELFAITTDIVYFIPPQKTDIEDQRIKKILNKLPKQKLNKFIYISTSGVYGDHKGGWVTEKTEPKPITDRAKRRMSAEKQIQTYIPTSIILRVPGIYGPQRLPTKRIESGEAIIDPKDASFTNLIHSTDLAHICLTALRNENAQGIYNISDGTPVTSSDYYFKVADLMGATRPPVISITEAQKQFSSMRLSFINESRRLDISKMEKELQPHIKFRDLNEGIKNSLEQ